MAYETYKLGKRREMAPKRRFTREELEELDLPKLKELCRREQMKPSTVHTFQSKEELIELLYPYLGTVKQSSPLRMSEEGNARFESRMRERGIEQEWVGVELPSQLKIPLNLDSLLEEELGYEMTASVPLGRYAFLVDGERKVQAIFQMTPTKRDQGYSFFLKGNRISKGRKEGRNRFMSLVFFTREGMEEVEFLYQHPSRKQTRIPYFLVPVPEVVWTKRPETNDVLVIDYGTSYTTAGTYDPKTGTSKRIGFASSGKEEGCASKRQEGTFCESCELCPSVIGVKCCTKEPMEFVYGQDAIRQMQEEGYRNKNSVFYDMKRWVLHSQEKIQVTDQEGNPCEVEGRVLVRAFLLFIIQKAQQQNKVTYKNLSFTFPVKQKALFLALYQEALPEYQIVMKDRVDEGMAVLYHSLERKMKERSYESGSCQRVMVFDCGGGTSDLVRCDYRITNQSITSRMDWNIRYTHGDTNFGGNNLTYRMVQYLKIRLAQWYTKTEPKPLSQLFSQVLPDLYEFVDGYGVEKAYEAFQERYQWAESILPTCFEAFPNATESTRLRIKGNYYFLWQLAETLKRELFETVGVTKVSLNQLFSQKEGNKASMPSFTLSVIPARKGLETEPICPELTIWKEEIEILLKPDVYGLIKKLMEPYYEEGSLSEIQELYLSGQTCKMELFREVLKEFLPGRKAKARGESSCVKKFLCLEGAIAYQEAKKVGRIRPVIQYESPLVPYLLTAPDFQGAEQEIVLMEAGTPLEEVYGSLSRPIETEEVTFTLKDRMEKELNQIRYLIQSQEQENGMYSDFLQSYPFLRQEDIDQITEGELKLFVFGENENWGFWVLEVARNQKGLWVRKPQYLPFETTSWETNFFDGYH